MRRTQKVPLVSSSSVFLLAVFILFAAVVTIVAVVAGRPYGNSIQHNTQGGRVLVFRMRSKKLIRSLQRHSCCLSGPCNQNGGVREFHQQPCICHWKDRRAVQNDEVVFLLPPGD